MVIGAWLVHPHSVLCPPWTVQHCTPLLAGGRVAVPDVPSALSVEPAMSRSSLRPLQWPVADCSARCPCLASQLSTQPTIIPGKSRTCRGIATWHSVLHTSHLAFHIFTAGTLVACSRALPGHQRSVLNPLEPFSIVPPPSGGWQIYSAWCLGVAFCYLFPFVMLSLCDGDEASPSVLSVEPALCRSALHPPLQAGGSLAVLEGRASPPHLNAGLRLTLRPILCSSTASLAIFSTT